MEEKKLKAEKKEKMSYEELENVAHQLSEQNRQMYARMQEYNMANTFKRLDYLFKVIEQSVFFKQEFVDKCIAEVEDIMTIPEEKTDDKGQ